MTLKTPISKIAGIGPAYIERLRRLQITQVRDLMYHFPFRYEDLSRMEPIANLKEGDIATVRGQVWEIQNIRTRTGKWLTKALVNDGSGSIDVVWFNQPYLTKSIKTGTEMSLAGKVGVFGGKLSLTSPDFELGGPKRHTGRVVPVYPETEGLSSKWLRTKLSQILPMVLVNLREYLPGPVLAEHNLEGLTQAMREIHQPESVMEIEAARRRFGFEEFFILSLASLIRKSFWLAQAGVRMKEHPEKLAELISSLPYQLTSAQKRVWQEVASDLGRDKPMNRLLEGDVGSGKTVVAALAAYTAYQNGYQTAVMAPTEILAQQHFQTLSSILGPQGLKIGLRTGSRKTAVGDVTVGTHALLGGSTRFEKLGLVVIDEQHRFGVEQRALLKGKGPSPHTLTMTATPIPRTLALTLYGDLDLSILDELPPGRKRVKTYLTPPEKRSKAYEFLREKVAAGQQAFIITPLIEPSETLTTLKSVKEEHRRLSEEVFPDLRLGLLHGRLKPREKERVLQDFRNRKIDILVSTPVVEVGIDIPNASVMVVEGSERFGLAQLHQLRGRVGRGEAESWCLLFSDALDGETEARLKALETHFLGEELAELDLRLRGPGEMYGLRQSGLPDLKIASLSDTALINETRRAAQQYLDGRPKIPPGLVERLDSLLTFKAAPD